MTSIVLTTLNARYIHSSLGLRYLYANLGDLQQDAALVEATIDTRPIDIAERLLAYKPTIIGLGVYIWNIDQATELVGLLKAIAPQVLVVLGGPEVSHEADGLRITAFADYIVAGAADKRFATLCRQILTDEKPTNKFIQSPFVPPNELDLPYRFYRDEDIAQRVIYVEASRGCPFKCEFCLSSLDKTAWPFDIDAFLDEMDALHQRGARHFKFVDRTFNLKVGHSVRILQFFLDRLDEHLFLHFELIPDHLPERLTSIIAQFPPGSLQFEIGIQSFTPQVQQLIQRRQKNAESKKNLTWLRQHTHAHIHADLIFGLPGEDLNSFGESFDQLVALDPHEIQVGILKRLRGTPIGRHADAFNMSFNPSAPYNILRTDRVDFLTLQRINRFARYWDMIANSGRFLNIKPLILRDDPFRNFLRLSDWLFAETGQTHKISLRRLFELLCRAIPPLFDIDSADVDRALGQDYARCRLKGSPPFPSSQTSATTDKPPATPMIGARQARHRT